MVKKKSAKPTPDILTSKKEPDQPLEPPDTIPKPKKKISVLTREKKRLKELYGKSFNLDMNDVVMYSDLPSNTQLKNEVEVKKNDTILAKKEEVKDEKELLENNFFHKKYKEKLDKDTREHVLRTVITRIDELGIKPFPLPQGLDDEFLDSTFTRLFFTGTYGGNTQQTFPSMDMERVEEHGIEHFMFMNLKWNPYGPRQPENPGLFYECFLELSRYTEPRYLFARMDTNKWLYLGLYQLILTDSMTRQEWLETPEETRATWCKNITEARWGKGVCKRVALRKRLGREPTEREQVERWEGRTRLAAVTPDDIREEYDSGRERLAIWALKCIGYDENFQQELIDGQMAWNIGGVLNVDDDGSKKIKVEPKLEEKTHQVRKGGRSARRQSNDSKPKKEPKKEEELPCEACSETKVDMAPSMDRSTRSSKRKREATQVQPDASRKRVRVEVWV